MPIFPLPTRINTYKIKGCGFGAPRDGDCRHAGCDLIAPEGTEVYAVEDGTVLTAPYPFYHGTHAFEVKHPEFIVRYSEVWGTEKGGIGLNVGQQVTKGEVIAKVGKMDKDSMLHLEFYSDTENKSPLTDRSNPPYMRRADLVDAASYLDSWPLKSEDGGDGGSASAEEAAPAEGEAAPAAIDLETTLGVQQALLKLGFAPGTPDGKGGPQTRSAIRAFQEEGGLDADGKVGAQTRAALSAALAKL